MDKAAAKFWGVTKVVAAVSVASTLAAYAEADETGRAILSAAGVAGEVVEAAYAGPCAEADEGWDF